MVAIIMDISDGRVARAMHAESLFGVELDSLADFLSFGIAPSILMYQLLLKDMGKIGFAIAIFFVIGVCTSSWRSIIQQYTRMAVKQPPIFEGLPTYCCRWNYRVICSFI